MYCVKMERDCWQEGPHAVGWMFVVVVAGAGAGAGRAAAVAAVGADASLCDVASTVPRRAF